MVKKVGVDGGGGYVKVMSIFHDRNEFTVFGHLRGFSATFQQRGRERERERERVIASQSPLSAVAEFLRIVTKNRAVIQPRLREHVSERNSALDDLFVETMIDGQPTVVQTLEACPRSASVIMN